MKKAVIILLGGLTVNNVVHTADSSQLVRPVLRQCPDLGDVVTLVLPHIQVRL